MRHPIAKQGAVLDDGKFKIEAEFLEHSVDNLGWRITEPDTRKFDDEKLKGFGVRGPMVRELQEKGKLVVDGKEVLLDDVSWIRPGDSIAIIIDTRYCQNAVDLARGAKVLLCESTYQEDHYELAKKHYHLTAKQAATLAKEAGVQQLILTHFSARYQNGKGFEKEAKEIFPNTLIGEDLQSFPFKK